MSVSPADAASAILSHPLPETPSSRITLLVIRRMGAHGLHDAAAAHALFSNFRQGLRRPLVLLRAFMADLAATAEGTIAIAPCCCPRMTGAEAALIAVLARVEVQPEAAHLLLADLLGTRRVDGVLASAAAVAAAFADAGLPIS
jgi:hypothetical protein